MTSEADLEKQALRQEILARLKHQTPGERAQASAQACERLRRQPVWREAQAVLLYAALPGEIDLTPMIVEALAAGKLTALPRFNPSTQEYEPAQIRDLAADCIPGKFGVLEPKPGQPPVPLKRLDFVLAPGVAFDVSGHRLGRGRGFYDRLLAHLTAARCGAAFECQIVARIPVHAHDIRMNFVLTELQWRAASEPPSA